MNYGLIEQPQKSTDYLFGAINKNVRVENGNWTKYLPEKELQNKGFETMACVTFSALNCIESIMMFEGIYRNFSDRFTAKMSGTTKAGNTLAAVAKSLDDDGQLPEELWPFEGKDWNEYYRSIPKQLADLAGKNKLTLTYEWISTSDKTAIKNALRYAPIQVCVYAWNTPINGIYPDDKTKRRNHAVMLFNYKDGEYWEIYDHYDKVIKRVEWDYDFAACLQFEVYNFMKNQNIRIIKDKNSSAVGIWLPALSEEALKSYCLNFGIEVPKKEDGGIDWTNWIDGELELKKI